MPHLASIGWDFGDRMQSADLGGGGTVYFTYDAAGQRVRKLRVNLAGTSTYERIYLGGFELYREHVGTELRLERETLHIGDDAGRVCLVETKTIDDAHPVTTPASVSRYQYGNHLGTVGLELDETGQLISYEELHPYGTTAYRAANGSVEVSPSRYRYTGKERDEETGLGYHGARYYASWLARWTAADPIGLGDGVNRYAYVHGNPVGLNDPSGTEGEEPFKIGQTITRQQAEEFAKDSSKGEEGAFPVVLPGGQRYHVLSESSVDVLPGVSSGVEGHVAWEFKSGDTAKYSYERAAALEASRVSAERSYQLAAQEILGKTSLVEPVATVVLCAVGGAAAAGCFIASVDEAVSNDQLGKLGRDTAIAVGVAIVASRIPGLRGFFGAPGSIRAADGTILGAAAATRSNVSLGAAGMQARASTSGGNPLAAGGAPKALPPGPPAPKALGAGRPPVIGHATPWQRMTAQQRKAFQHTYSRHAAELGLPSWKGSQAEALRQRFNAVTQHIRDTGTIIPGVRKPLNGQSVPVNFYESTLNGTRYYYYETLEGQFISAGLAR
jgi:RHS repeat-associated protein